MYHFVATLVKVLWERCNLMESSINEFEEHQGWNAITWLVEYSLGFHSNLEMSEACLVGIAGHLGLCYTDSLVNFAISYKFKVSKNGNFLCAI